MSPTLSSAIIASSMFIRKYLLIYHLRDTLPSLTEIFEILIVKIFEMKSLNKTGQSMNQKIQIWYGLTGKQNFCALLTHLLRSRINNKVKTTKASYYFTILLFNPKEMLEGLGKLLTTSCFVARTTR